MSTKSSVPISPLSIVGHDLKTPLNTILGYSNFLLDEMKSQGADPEWQNIIERIAAASVDGLKLADNLLTISKLESGQNYIEPINVENLNRELQETVDGFNHSANLKSINLRLLLIEELPTVNWDITRIRVHVLNNIISNAIQYTPPGGEVLISAEEKDGLIHMMISDTGPGIPESDLEKVFAPFERLSHNYNSATAGTGLGLAIARNFIESHRGRISIKNNSNSNGAIFTISLPLNPDSN